MKRIIVLCLCATALLMSCSSTKVYMDYDKDTKFKTYQTYNYFLVENTGLSELDQKRVIKALDSILPQKGYSKETIPDFNVNFYVETYTVNNQSSIGVGLGGGGGRVGGGVSGGIPHQYFQHQNKDRYEKYARKQKEEIIVSLHNLEFIDAFGLLTSKELYWQAVVETKFKQLLLRSGKRIILIKQMLFLRWVMPNTKLFLKIGFIKKHSS